MTLYLKAVKNLCGDGSFRLEGDDAYENIVEWFNVATPPTKAEVEVEFQRLTAEQAWKSLRTRRNQLLAETDWVTLQAVDASVDGLGVQLPVLWMTYRQELRDLPANTTDPANPVWPTKPGGAA